MRRRTKILIGIALASVVLVVDTFIEGPSINARLDQDRQDAFATQVVRNSLTVTEIPRR